MLCCLWRRWRSGRRRARPLCVPVLLVAPRVFRAPEGPAAREARASLRSAPRLEARPGPATAHRHCGRSLRRPPHRWRQVADVRCLEARPGLAGLSSPQPGRAFTPQASCPVLAHIAAESTLNFARNSPATLSNIEFRSLELQPFRTLLKLRPIELRARFRGSCSCRPSNLACNSLECVS